MSHEYTSKTELWCGTWRYADDYRVHETLPTVHANDAGKFVAVLRISRFGSICGELVEGAFDAAEDARAAALRLQDEFQPEVDAETTP